MKKFTLSLVMLFVLSFMLIGIVQAISVTINPTTITAGGTTTITVSSDTAATGTITVRTPSGKLYTQPLTISAGGSVSLNYPDNFPGASSTESGTYNVYGTLICGTLGTKLSDSFSVSTQMHTPELPIGTIGATAAMLAGLGLFVVKKRRQK